MAETRPQRCDFCGLGSDQEGWEPFIKYGVPMTSHYRVAGKPFFDDGIWYACEECAALVEANNVAELAWRGFVATGESASPRRIFRVRQIHMIFWHGRALIRN